MGVKSVNKVATATEADWSFYEDDATVAVVERAARDVARMYEGRGIERCDLAQDALLMVAIRPEMVEKHRGYPAYLYRDVHSLLVQQCKREVDRETVSYEKAGIE